MPSLRNFPRALAPVTKLTLTHLLQIGWLLEGDVLECCNTRGYVTGAGKIQIPDGECFDAPSPFLNYSATKAEKGNVETSGKCAGKKLTGFTGLTGKRRLEIAKVRKY